MALYGIRFDFRNPAFAETTMAERYRAALDMTDWAERLGFLFVGLSEHHGVDDGYLPSALTMAAAMAGRTSTIRIGVTAIVAALHDPLRLAEEAAVVDLLSEGRLDLTLANGYVASEFDMFDRSLRERAKRTTEAVETLRKAWTGEPFDFRGRTVRVTPAPYQPGGPRISLGGSTEPAARRAARIADGFIPSMPGVWDHYRDERQKLGEPDPGPWPGSGPTFVHVAADPERAWARIGPYAVYESNAYGASMAAAGLLETGGFRPVDSVDELRTTGQYQVVSPDDLVAELTAQGPFAFVLFHPMMGGIPPELAWESLELFESEVLPRLA
jgi:alkanesulfonate monooxygenase SsuD/methylene tetrahydromethanopterin reductase-like flavin-dependent oxidoreductase (luciferase family)